MYSSSCSRLIVVVLSTTVLCISFIVIESYIRYAYLLLHIHSTTSLTLFLLLLHILITLSTTTPHLTSTLTTPTAHLPAEQLPGPGLPVCGLRSDTLQQHRSLQRQTQGAGRIWSVGFMKSL